METPRYLVIDTNGAYMPRDPTVKLLELGSDRKSSEVYGIHSPVFDRLAQGDEIDFDGVPGPHLKPLNEAARERMEAYWVANPGADLDPTRRVKGGVDGMGGRSLEQLVGSLLDGMERDAERSAPAKASSNDLLLRQLVEGQAAMQQAMTALLAALTPNTRGTK